MLSIGRGGRESRQTRPSEKKKEKDKEKFEILVLTSASERKKHGKAAGGDDGRLHAPRRFVL